MGFRSARMYYNAFLVCISGGAQKYRRGERSFSALAYVRSCALVFLLGGLEHSLVLSYRIQLSCEKGGFSDKHTPRCQDSFGAFCAYFLCGVYAARFYALWLQTRYILASVYVSLYSYFPYAICAPQLWFFSRISVRL